MQAAATSRGKLRWGLLDGPRWDQLVDLLHEAHGLREGDDDLLVVEETVEA